jgi:ABC-type branched-subunit amino acid transport system ATPase component
MSTLRDMNLSKLVAQDVPLFLSLLSDLFPALGMPAGMEHTELKKALTTVVEGENLVMHPSWSIKVVQLYETTLVRHGIMMVGPPGSGKTRITHCLQDALSTTTGVVHKRTRMNPKAIRAEEMFGETDKVQCMLIPTHRYMTATPLLTSVPSLACHQPTHCSSRASGWMVCSRPCGRSSTTARARTSTG